VTLENQSWISGIAEQAKAAGHIWHEMAACEAGLESAFGQSTLAKEALNLFGMKAHAHWFPSPIGQEMVSLPTKEFLDGKWVATSAEWMKYATIADCFADRMATLRRLAPHYPHYAAALAAQDAYTYVTEVSKTWSTDPQRAEKCIAIYTEYFRGNNASAVQDAAAT